METRYLWISLIALILGLCFLQASAADKKAQPIAPTTQKTDDVKFTLKDVPEIARKTLKLEARGEELDNVKQKTVDGKTVYQAKAEINGQVYTFQVDEEGKLISKKAADPKTAEEKAAKKAEKTPK